MGLRAPPPPADEADANPLHDATWLYSYADLMTQLLIFSILMLTVMGLKEPEAPRKDEPKPRDALAETVRELDKLVAQKDLAAVMAVDKGADHVVIRMKSVLLFKEGQAELTDRARRVLDDVEALLAKVPNDLRVEGHTDDVPIRSAQFPSNWELSSARAISVVRHLEERGIPAGRLSVAGYGEFHPIARNDNADQRALNRRVELVVLGASGAR